jgi:2-keto-4-pentenoate hydratase/2-oxohepta-3-ene-1,7-dioic acid hydratase in catechol pathway
MVGETRGLIAWVAATLASFAATAQDLEVHAACRDGLAHGAYELRSASGQLRVAGAFNRGKRTGSFIFWTRDGTRVAHIPYDEDHVSGTLSLWFQQVKKNGDAQQKLQAGFAGGHRNGISRSWYPNGRLRAIYRYEADALADAKAWSATGAPLSEVEARKLALRDREEDEQYYASLDAMVLAHLPACEQHSPGRAHGIGASSVGVQFPIVRGGNMPTNKRRELLQAAAALAASGVAAQTSAADTAMTIRTPFEVADTYIPIAGSTEQFPVRRIYCIGRNYAAHAREMGSDPNREPPFFFQKPTDAIQIVPPGETIDHPYPTLTKNYHYEVELVAALAKGGRNVPVDRALDLVYAYTVGLDMTRRDLQRAMGDEKKPWEIGKSFDRSAPLGPLQPAGKVGHLKDGAIWLKVNGQIKQNANLNQMIWSVAEQISKLSEAFELAPGDIIYSGTPENVGPVVKGDIIDAHIDGLPDIRVRII